MTMPETHGTKADGTPITDEMVEAMADEAERGYDVEEPAAPPWWSPTDGVGGRLSRVGAPGPRAQARSVAPRRRAADQRFRGDPAGDRPVPPGRLTGFRVHA